MRSHPHNNVKTRRTSLKSFWTEDASAPALAPDRLEMSINRTARCPQ